MTMPTDRSLPVTVPDAGYELCYECDGERLCLFCHGKGRLSDGERCYQCAFTGRCIVCNGDGQLVAGTKASLRP
jgi:RecJ-like exonuclease